MGIFLYLKSILRPIIVPYTIDSKGLNLALALKRIFLAFYICFVVYPNVIGMPWNLNRSSLDLFEISPLLIEEMSGYRAPISDVPYFFGYLFSLTKTLGSLLIILGLSTRIIGVCYFLVAAFYLYNYPYVSDFNYAFPIVFVTFSLLLLYFGGGKYSLDYRIGKKFGWIRPYRLSS